ncbi:MAG TPA: type II toxin-antitoxin system ParD family antitoxin [Silvibacterium sp.]|nr:type II toxin-antitoxin system ParD family antitoxin [Silvibacterium sp.]
MNISITPKLAGYVRTQVKKGRYNNASEVVRDAIRRMQEVDAATLRLAAPAAEAILADLTAVEIELVRRKVLAGIGSIEAGRYVECDGEEGIRKLIEGVKSRGRKRLHRSA